MYEAHFGLRCLPFETLSNGALFVDLPTHRRAANTVVFGLRSGEGFIKVVGEVGTGKTALCRNLVEALRGGRSVAYLPSPALPPLDLGRALADELDIPLPDEPSMHAVQRELQKRLIEIARNDQPTVILVDEAQTVPDASFEMLRLLSNLETSRSRVVQVVLFAQPELDHRLQSYALRPLRQRIALASQLEALDRRDCDLYVHRRLLQAGTHAQALFTPRALDRIHRASRGLPRMINILCHKSLLAAYASGEFQVRPRHVRRAIADTEGVSRWRGIPLLSRRAARTGGAHRTRHAHGTHAGWR